MEAKNEATTKDQPAKADVRPFRVDPYAPNPHNRLDWRAFDVIGADGETVAKRFWVSKVKSKIPDAFTDACRHADQLRAAHEAGAASVEPPASSLALSDAEREAIASGADALIERANTIAKQAQDAPGDETEALVQAHKATLAQYLVLCGMLKARA